MGPKITVLFIFGVLETWTPSVWCQGWAPAPNIPPDGQKLGPLNGEVPVVRFECDGRLGGYYGDMDFGCTVFHYCADSGQRFTYRCNQGLKFNEITTSCSAGYFGDCTHPEIVGSAGRNMSADPAPVESFQDIPIYKEEERKTEIDPRDYPEPFIQHYDPALDLDYDYQYYDHEYVNPLIEDAEVSASSNNHVKRSPSSTWDTGMSSALSAFASLVNMPLDNPSSAARENIDRSDNFDHVEYVDTIDRAFVGRSRPQPRKPPSRRFNNDQFLQLPFFRGSPKKPGKLPPPRFPAKSHNFMKFHHQGFLHPPPVQQKTPHESHASHLSRNPHESHSNHQSRDPYESGDSYASPEEAGHNTTPDTFRPSSLLTNDPDDFQPITPPSVGETTDLIRPSRDANHQIQHGALATSFQSFSPSSSSSSFNSFLNNPNEGFFSNPRLSPRPNPQRIRTTHSNPNIPPSGSFTFNQPPINLETFNEQLQHTPEIGQIFGQPSGSPQQTQTFHFGHPGAPNEQSFNRPFNFQPANSFIHPGNPQNQVPSFHHSTSPPIQNFATHPTILPEQNFGGVPSTFDFGQSPQEHLHSLSRPTETPAFLPQTPSPFRIQHHSLLPQQERPELEDHQQNFPQFVSSTETPDFHQPVTSPFPSGERPVLINEQTGLQHDVSPLSVLGVQQGGSPPFPQTVRPVVANEPVKPIGQGLSLLRNPNFPVSSTFRPSTTRSPSVTGLFDFNKEILKDPQLQDQSHTQRPKATTIARPPFDPRPQRRRPIGTTNNRQSVRRRPVRPNAFTPTTIATTTATATPLTTSPTPSPFVTGLKNGGFRNPFPRPIGRLPSKEQLKPEISEEDLFLNTAPLTTPGSLPVHPGVISDFQPDVSKTNTRPQTEIPLRKIDDNKFPIEILNVVDSVEVNNNIPATEYDYGDYEYPEEEVPNIVTDTTTTTTTTTTPRPTTTTRRPLLKINGPLRRRRPGTGNRLSIRQKLRTTPAPTQPTTEQELIAETEESIPISSTTITPFRQRLRDRLNRFKSRNRQNSQGTTAKSPTETTPGSTTTTASSPRRITSRLNSERFQRYRNRLRNRVKSFRTTNQQQDQDEISDESGTGKSTGLEPNDDSIQGKELDTHPAGSNEGNILQVKEILRTDQDTQETRQLIIEEKLPNTQQSSVSETPYEEPLKDEVTPVENDLPKKTQSGYLPLPDSEDVPKETQIGYLPLPDSEEDYEGTESKSVSSFEVPTQLPEEVVNEDNNPVQNTDMDTAAANNNENGRKIVNPNFRARFREFLKNRKDRLSARYRTSPSPDHMQEDVQKEEEEEKEVKEDNDSEHLVETSTSSIQERMEQFNKKRQEARARFLANRHSDDNRNGRRIPLRPLRNKLQDETSGDKSHPDIDEKSAEENSEYRLKVREGVIELQPTSRFTPKTQKISNEQVIVPLQTKVIEEIVTDGFRPAIGPFQGKPFPIHENSQKSENTDMKKEPEIITAPSTVKEQDEVISLTVSASLGQETPKDTTVDDDHFSKVIPDTGKNENTEEQKEITDISSLSETKPESEPSELSEPLSDSMVQDSDLDSDNLPSSIQNSHSDADKSSTQMKISDLDADKSPVHLQTPDFEKPPLLIHIGKEVSKSSETKPSMVESPSVSTSRPLISDGKSPLKPTRRPTNGRGSRPTFTLGLTTSRPNNGQTGAISASDFSGELAENETPVPLLAITMATDPPRLPLEMLMPLFNNR